MKRIRYKLEAVAALTQERRLTSSMGRANAPVFPEPVCANPMMSLSAAGKKQQRLSHMFHYRPNGFLFTVANLDQLQKVPRTVVVAA